MSSCLWSLSEEGAQESCITKGSGDTMGHPHLLVGGSLEYGPLQPNLERGTLGWFIWHNWAPLGIAGPASHCSGHLLSTSGVLTVSELDYHKLN